MSNYYIKHILTGLLLICTIGTTAAPARRNPFTITLASGEQQEVVKCGDEHRHWFQSPDGEKLILQAEDGKWVVASDVEKSAFFARPVAKARGQKKVGQFSPTFPTTGEMRSLVVLVNFSDVKMSSPTAHEDFQRMMTEENYSHLGGTGSARDYYIENSMGQFSPYFDVVGPVTLSHGYAYYGENTPSGDDAHAEEMIIEACRLLDNEVDFTQYDCNDDGYIDNVFVFYAGYGEATTSDTKTIWPHSYNITEHTSTPILLDGKRLDHYACTNELSSDGKMDGIGTFVHEFGHVLGLPDLYSTQNTYAFTPNIWSVMDEGEYNNDSRTPPFFTAYERYFLGWLNPVEVLKDGCSLAINDISQNEAYIIHTSRKDEYFLLENRQQQGWDSFIPGHGMLVWHIDYDPYLWSMNRVNNISTHQYVDIVEADNIQSSGTRSADPFPGTANITSYTATTIPSFRNWDGEDVGCPLTNIRETNGVIYLDASGGGAPLEPIRYITPVMNDAEGITSSSFLASWQQVDEADGYRLYLGKMQAGAVQEITADFTGGLTALSQEWQTNVTSTYSNASYAGASTPSLRMQKDGDAITCTKDGICSVSFWCRGSSVKAGTIVEVEWISASGQILQTDTYDLTTTGTTVRFNTPESKVSQLSIIYRPAAGSGSLAIDDITVGYAAEEFKAIKEPLYTSGTTLEVTGLAPATEYSCYVVAVKGVMHSLQSNIISITTLSEDEDVIAVTPAVSDSSTSYYDLLGRKVANTTEGLLIRKGYKVTGR